MTETRRAILILKPACILRPQQGPVTRTGRGHRERYRDTGRGLSAFGELSVGFRTAKAYTPTQRPLCRRCDDRYWHHPSVPRCIMLATARDHAQDPFQVGKAPAIAFPG